MSNTVEFARMNGLGNKILVVDMRGRKDVVTAAAATALNADPATQFDQIMAIHDPKAQGTDAWIDILNSDGTKAQACGNGTRCVVQALAAETGKKMFTFQTVAGILNAVEHDDGTISVDMGKPVFAWDKIPLAEEFADTRRIELQIGPIDNPVLHSPSVMSMGNPHAIFWVDKDPMSYDLARFGPLLENHPMFPERANITLAQVLSPTTVRTRTWERGAGLTLALRFGRLFGRRQRGAHRPHRPQGDDRRRLRPGTEPTHHRMAGERRSRRHDRSSGMGVVRCSRSHDGSLDARSGAGGSGAVSGVEVITFGCRLNTYESEVMRAEAEKAGLNNAILVNTCAVTGEAVRQARQAIRRARRDNPHARIIVTGCAAQTEKHAFAEMAEVDAVLGNEEKLTSASYRSLPDFGVSAEEKLRVNDIMSVRATAPQMIRHIDGHVRAFVQVQNGCDHRCTFCIILYGRGNSRSVPMGAVVSQARNLVESGYREIVLTGVDATSYGADLPGQPSLGLLAKTLLKQIPRSAGCGSRRSTA